MNDLISRNKLQQNRPEWLNENCVGREEHNKGWNACNEMWLKTIAEQPTVEAVPVVHGEWILEEKAGVDYWCCSHCHKIRSEYYAKPKDNFCHNCGTYMRKKENKENDES